MSDYTHCDGDCEYCLIADQCLYIEDIKEEINDANMQNM